MFRQIYYNIMSCRNKENIITEGVKPDEGSLQNITVASDLILCDEQSPITAILTNSVVDRYVS
jgi:hypothetical protein